MTWFLVSDQDLWVGLCVQDYKSLCAAVKDLCHPDCQIDRHTHRQRLTSLYEKLGQLS